MPKIEIEVDDNGNLGALPDPLQRAFDRKVSESVKTAEKNIEEKLKPRLRSEADEERLKLLADENARFKEDEAKRKGDHDEAKRLAEERYNAAIKERDDKLTATQQELARRDGRLRTSLGAEVRAAATAAGARDESLPELVTLIGHALDLDPETLEPFVKGADGKPLEKDGKRVSIESHVQQYLADHPHHIHANRGKSGRAPGGATFRGQPPVGDKDAALAAAEEQPTAANVNAGIRAIRSKAS